MLPSVLTAKIQSYQLHSDFGVLRVKKAAWRDVGGMLACEQAILPAIDEKQHGGSHYAEKPQLLRSAFCILPGCRNRSAISGNARWDRRKYRTETSTRKTSAALLHPRVISDPEKIYRGLRSQHTLLRVPNKIESTDLDATRQCYRAMRKTEVAADQRPLRLCSYVFCFTAKQMPPNSKFAPQRRLPALHDVPRRSAHSDTVSWYRTASGHPPHR